jgi:hypothetical protein
VADYRSHCERVLSYQTKEVIFMTKGGARIVARIEKAFVAYSKERVNHVSFTQLKDWLNSNTREGISSPRLGAYLKRTPKFVKVQTYRRVGTNSTETFWSLGYSDLDSENLSGWEPVRDDYGKARKNRDTGII